MRKPKPKPKKTKIADRPTAWESACELAREDRAAREEFRYYHTPTDSFVHGVNVKYVFPKRPATFRP